MDKTELTLEKAKKSLFALEPHWSQEAVALDLLNGMLDESEGFDIIKSDELKGGPLDLLDPSLHANQ